MNRHSDSHNKHLLLLLLWNQERLWKFIQPQSHISLNCSFNQLSYVLTLMESEGILVQQRVISSAGCRNGVCNITFSSFAGSNQDYHISLTANNSIGYSRENITSNKIGTHLIHLAICHNKLVLFFPNTANSISNLMNLSINFLNCFTFINCVSPKSTGNCSIQYGLDPSYQDLSPPVQTSLNTPITLPFMTPSTYYYLLTVIINSSLPFQIR